MTRIDFYHDAPDKLQTAARIVAKAFGQGQRVLLFAPDRALAERIDRLLWSQPPTGFLPHCRDDSPLAAETPVLISGRLDPIAHEEVLINLDAAVPPGFSRFQRLIEIVGRDEADKAPARERYRFYLDRGYAISRHNLGES